jgi:ubiquinone/menaquinone biosynthesis C-methylase UbiE
MPRPPQELIDRFSERYGTPTSVALDEIETNVIGGVFGANGYTTKAQVDELIRDLHLSRDSRVLDVGAGRGWPSLYIAESVGCEVVMADIPEPGLRIALARADEKQIGGSVHPIMATAERLPLRSRSFDAVVHTDVL